MTEPSKPNDTPTGAYSDAGAELIRFRCPQCTRSWKVEAKHAGKKFRCPACYKERTIPDKNVEEPAADQLYGVNETVRDTREIIREQSLVSFRCRICRAGLAASTDQVGQTVLCPDCDTPNVVPEPKPKEEKKEPAEPVEIYGFAGMGDGSPQYDDESMFSVRCPLCHALLYARDDQIGTSLKCPDCYRDVPVRGWPEKPVKEKFAPKVYEGSSTYELAAADRLPPETQLVPVVCSLCYTRMYATVDQIGQEKECPDCGKMNLIKPVAKEDIKTAADLFVPSGGYGVGEIADRPKMRVNVDYRTVDGAVVEREPSPTDDDGVDLGHLDPAEMAERIENRAKRRSQGIGVVTYRRPKLPKRPLTRGYWKLFGYMSSHVHMILAMLFFLLAAPAVVPLIEQYAPEVGQLAGGTKEGVVVYMFMYLYLAIFLFGGSCYLSQICMAVSTSTANGADEVDEWGGFSPMLALGSLICVGGAVAIGWTPAILWRAVMGITETRTPVPGVLMLACAAMSFILFPVVLMRFLEGFEKHVIKSNAVWSIRLIPGVWLRFYLLSVLCLIVPALLIWKLFYSPNTTIKTICSFGLAFFLPFCSLCYFRLFGRLGWAVEVAVDKKLQELEAKAAAEEDDDWSDEPEERGYDSRIDLPDHALRD